MADPVSVEHGGVTITTNTMSEADLRAEMTAPAAPSETPPAETPPPVVRDEKGRFAKVDTQPPPDTPAPASEPAAAEAAPASEAPSRDEGLPRHDPQARMKKALAQKAEAERRAAALEAELARLRQPPSVTSPVTSPSPPIPPTNGYGGAEPQSAQFEQEPDPYTAYFQAWTRWDRAQALAQARVEWEAEQTAKLRAQQFESRLAAGRTQYPDFDQVLTEADTLGLQVSAVMQSAIADSPRAADLVYYLATHPEECTQLAEESQQTPVAAATVMRRLLESHLASPAAASNGAGPAARSNHSTAKPPVTPVGSSPVVADEPPGDTASAAEHARYWNRRLKVPGSK
jgi:hypothetical protein